MLHFAPTHTCICIYSIYTSAKTAPYRSVSNGLLELPPSLPNCEVTVTEKSLVASLSRKSALHFDLCFLSQAGVINGKGWVASDCE